jgi:hypothetical protein
MRVTYLRLAVVVPLAGLFVAPAPARKLEDWPHDKLLKAADVVVIALPTKAKETEDQMGDSPWKQQEFVGVDTTFRVKSVLKGKPVGDDLTVLHFKLKDPEVKIINGPLLVSFRLTDVCLELKESKLILGPPEYLLYLTERKDGRYEPVSGRVDPALSVWEMYRPLRGLQDEKPKK